jgi:hypothetical protein
MGLFGFVVLTAAAGSGSRGVRPCPCGSGRPGRAGGSGRACRVDLPVLDQVDQLGQEPAHRRRPAEQLHVGEEQLGAGRLDLVGDAEIADMPPGRVKPMASIHSWVPTASMTECTPQPVRELPDLCHPAAPWGWHHTPDQLRRGSCQHRRLIPVAGGGPLQGSSRTGHHCRPIGAHDDAVALRSAHTAPTEPWVLG